MGTWVLQEKPVLLLARGQSLALALRQNYIARLTTPEVTVKRVASQRVTFAKRRETKSSEYWHGKFLLLEQFNSRSVLSIYTFDHLPVKGLFLKLGDDIIFEKSRETLSEIKVYGAK